MTTTTTTAPIITAATIAADKSTKQLVAVAGTLGKLVAELMAQAEVAPAVMSDIAFAEQQLEVVNNKITSAVSESEVMLSEQERKAVAELNLRLIENEDTVLLELLEKRGLAMVTTVEMDKIKTDLEVSQRDTTEEIAAAVTIATETANQAAENDKIKAEAEHKVEIATQAGLLDASNAKVAHLEQSIITLNGMINSEREAQTSRFASAQPVIQQAPGMVAQR